MGASDHHHEQITEDLIDILKEHSDIKRMLERSIAMAKEKNPDGMTNPAQSLLEYYAYLDWCAKPMPWTMKPLDMKASVFERIDQGLEYFYYILDQPLEELNDRGYFYNSLQYVPAISKWMKSYAQRWGEFLSSEGSWDDECLQAVTNEPRFCIDKGWYEDPLNWHSFNDFFSRKLSSPDVRPIDGMEDDSVVVSPADSLPQGIWDIDADSLIASGEGVLIKSNPFYSIRQLIGHGSNYEKAFAGGKLTHTFLNVDDYHRYHFPVSGTVAEIRKIPASDAAGGITVWNENAGKYNLDSCMPGWQWVETRACVIIETKEFGCVAVLPIGMSQVSSVNFTENVKVGAEVKKGDDLGYFLFGGSDIAMIFQKKADFHITCKKSDDNEFCHILMGQRYGTV